MVGTIEPEDDLGEIRDPAELFEDVLKDGQILRVSVLGCQERNDQYRFFPAGVELELGSQMPPILPQYMEGGYLGTVL